MSIRQFRIMTMVVTLLILLSSIYPVGAAPPEPTKEPSSTPEPPVGEHTTINIGNHTTIDIEIKASPQSPATPSAAPLLQDSKSDIGSDKAISLLAVDGHWTGTTNRGYPMSFDVASGGTTWSNFKLKTNFSVGGCSGTVETTVFGPGSVTNNQFSGGSGSFSFSGHFNSSTTASGTYAYNNNFIPGCGNFTQSGTWTANTIPPPQPNPPSNLIASALSRMQILLSWQDNSNNESGFKIEQSLNGTSGWVQIATTSSNITSRVLSGLNCDTRYYYRVRAYNASGNSSYSNTANAKTLICQTVPVAPSNLTATAVSTSQINLTWQDNSTNETGFRVERSPNNVTWAQIASVGLNVTHYANTGLNCGSTYFYRVRAYNATGNSPYSNTGTETTVACPVTSETNIYLPLVMKNFAAPTPPPPGSPPIDGHWTGTTSRGQPMSFDVSSGGTSLNNFKLKTDFLVGPCSGTTEITIPSPRAITNNQFSGGSGSFSFSGQFNSPTTASGTYAYINNFIPGCGTFSQSGSWTASGP